MQIVLGGGGRTAEFVAKRLIREGHELVLVEQNPDRCQHLETHLDAQVIHGDLTSLATWSNTAITKSDMLVALTASDEVNILVCLIADSIAPDLVKVIKLRSWERQQWEALLKSKGVRVDRLIHSETDVVARILRVLAVPGVSDIRDFADGRVKAFGMNVRSRSWLAGKTINDLNHMAYPKNSMVAMIFRGRQVRIPSPTETLLPGDHLYVVSSENELEATLNFMGIERKHAINEVFIVGGGQLGLALAQLLEKQRITVKIFERDVDRCERLSEALEHSVVICGDGTEHETLLQENVEDVDAFIALTKDDNTNMIASLLARRLGARKLVAGVNRVENILLAQRLGINSIVSPHVKTVDAILEFVRKGGVTSVRTLHGDDAEAIELIAPADGKYIGRPLKNIHFPHGVVVGAIVRPGGEVTVPRGEAVIEAEDCVVFFALEGCIAKLESEFLETPGA